MFSPETIATARSEFRELLASLPAQSPRTQQLYRSFRQRLALELVRGSRAADVYFNEFTRFESNRPRTWMHRYLNKYIETCTYIKNTPYALWNEQRNETSRVVLRRLGTSIVKTEIPDILGGIAASQAITYKARLQYAPDVIEIVERCSTVVRSAKAFLSQINDHVLYYCIYNGRILSLAYQHPQSGVFYHHRLALPPIAQESIPRFDETLAYTALTVTKAPGGGYLVHHFNGSTTRIAPKARPSRSYSRKNRSCFS